MVLTVQRPGQSQPLVITAYVSRRSKAGATQDRCAQRVANQILKSYPILFLIVGLAVLFLRIEDRNAWLLALVFAAFIAGRSIPNQSSRRTASFQSFL